MENILLIKIGELTLKKGNRRYFENTLLKNIKTALSDFKCTVRTERGRYFVEHFADNDSDKILDILSKVAGIFSISRAKKIEKSVGNLTNSLPVLIKEIERKGHHTFKFEAKRADKSFPFTSYELCAKLGEQTLHQSDILSVDVKNPDLIIRVEVREFIYIYYDKTMGMGGLPIGVSGKGLLLLSGGIDSPVAAIIMAKRGMNISGLHFLSPPYTGQAAKDKVKKLADIIVKYIPRFKLRLISVTKILEAIAKNCNPDYSTVLLRIFMIKIANHFVKTNSYQALITGESLAQVASQTIDSITITDSQRESLIFRPLVGLDKSEIIAFAKNFGTFETSIIQAEDCCTVFLPQHPVTRPKLENVLKEYNKIENAEQLIEEAIETLEKYQP